ncbi:putative chromatin remodeler Bromodomain family [Medicago truncatula]|uniref:Putative chromatin remodeler Bromodomain family n=1 Tax=Medicago truncatula TaxID=3880 RepID=A0A396HYD4_MEDTR|nr:putative chromatin remodeler Bromodomain family [Medicago truncatula]
MINLLFSIESCEVFHLIAKDKWAWPFLDPVDVEGLGLYDYYQIIEKPMDFSTIKIRMEAKDGSGYKNVREIYADESDLSKEEAHEELNKRLAQEATYANMTRELSTELSKVDMALRSLKTTAISQCRKLSHPEKLILANAFTKLSPDNIVKALEIVKESNPNFKDRIDMVTLDLDSQSDYTLFRLHMFVKNTLEVQEGTSVINHEDNIEEMKNNAKKRRIV